MAADRDIVHSSIWEEEPEPDNPFAARACYCSGYDVFGDLLGKIGWVEYLYLLFRLEPPEPWQTRLLERLAVALANPGPRDPSVRAAMCAGVGGSTRAAALMAALAPGAGQLGGAHEVFLAMQIWQQLGPDLQAWTARLSQSRTDTEDDIWPTMEHPPGFDPNAGRCATPVLQTLNLLADGLADGPLVWLAEQRLHLERHAGNPLAMSGVTAAAFTHLGFEPEQGEMLCMLLRLPGAAAHALEQERLGWRRYPLFTGKLHLEPDADPLAAND